MQGDFFFGGGEEEMGNGYGPSTEALTQMGQI